MQHSLRPLLAVALILAVVLSARTALVAATPAHGDKVPDPYIVVFKDGVADPAGKAQALAAQHGLGVQRVYS